MNFYIRRVRCFVRDPNISFEKNIIFHFNFTVFVFSCILHPIPPVHLNQVKANTTLTILLLTVMNYQRKIEKYLHTINMNIKTYNKWKKIKDPKKELKRKKKTETKESQETLNFM